MLIPHVTPTQLSTQPDQTARVINMMIDQLNELTRQK